MGFGVGLGERSVQPAVRARDDEPAGTIAFANDEDRADAARWEADDHAEG